MKKFIITLLIIASAQSSFGQIAGGFRWQNGHLYYLGGNQSPYYSLSVTIMAYSPESGNSYTESLTVAPGGGFYLGPTTSAKWYWTEGDTMTITYADGREVYWVCPQTEIRSSPNPSFGGKNSDGFIPDGTVTLRRTISGHIDTFKCYRKGGGLYINIYGRYIRVDGSGTVTINNIKYDKI